jgi:NAD(P)-dependent dehydrogenase (short-subunit alcohol dehydrogenase family)
VGAFRASAEALAKAGAQVLVHYSTRENDADAVVAEICKARGGAEKIRSDRLDILRSTAAPTPDRNVGGRDPRGHTD